MKLIVVCLLVCSLIAAIAATSSSARPQIDVGDCLQFTTTKGLNTNRILNGLPLTSDQVREVRYRLVQYNSVRGYPGIADLGLPPDVVTEINRRIQVQVAEWNKHPLGWPCAVFKNPAKTKAFVRQLLIDNGYRATLKVWKTSPRQFQLRGIQDGIDTFGIVAKSGPQQVIIFLTSPSDRYSQTKRFSTPFVA